MVKGHCFDALVFIPNCDKIVPGMLMAALRLNLPCIFVSGGPMLSIDERDLNSVFEAVGARKAVEGVIDDEELAEIEGMSCPGCGSCSGMFTANSMNCLTEVLGLGLPWKRDDPGGVRGADPAGKDRRNAGDEASGKEPPAQGYRDPGCL